MIQDISPYKFHNEYRATKPKISDIFLTYNKMNALAKKVARDVTFPTFADLGAQAEDAMNEAIYLFSVDDTPFFLLLDLPADNDSSYKSCECNTCESPIDDSQATILTEFEYIEIHQLYDASKTWTPLVVATGLHLNTWYKDNRFCGRCGKPMSHHSGLRALKCECGNLQFPRIAPVVLAAIVNDGKIVATRYKDRPYKGLALNAGFVEIGESLEEAIRREVEEEVGLKVSNIHYYASQPWGHTGIVMAGYFVEIEGDDTIVLDENELSEAVWFAKDELPEQTNKMSLTATMFEAFRTGKVHY